MDSVNLNFYCFECSKLFRDGYNLKRHVKSCHSTNDDRECPFCSKVFTFKSKIPKHINTCPKNPDARLASKPVKFCYHCGGPFTRKSDLRIHIEKFHIPENPKFLNKSLKLNKCPICLSVHHRKVMADHFTLHHGIQLEYKIIDFEDFNSFLEWKADLEINTRSKFNVRIRRKLKNLSKIVKYECNRSGNHRGGKRIGVRQFKSKETTKINAFCPAFLSVTIDVQNKVQAKLCATHVGHDHDLKRAFLSKEERQFLADKIASKITFDKILEEYKPTDGMDRVLTKKYLHNIARDFKIGTVHKLDTPYASNLENWLQKSNLSSSGDVIRYYKPRGVADGRFPLAEDDIALIIMNNVQLEILRLYGPTGACVDATYCSNDAFCNLVTLFVFNDLEEAFPVAFLYCNRHDRSTLSMFITIVKDSVGSIRTKTLITDAKKSVYEEWKSIMHPPTSHLFSSWSVKSAWTSNMNKIQQAKEERAGVFNSLVKLLNENDQSEFELEMSKFCSIISSDVSTTDFALYFEACFKNRSRSWAKCYRSKFQCIMDDHLEKMHHVLQSIHLEGKHENKVYQSFLTLMKAIWISIVETMSSAECSVESLLSSIVQGHRTCFDLTNITYENLEPNKWMIRTYDGEPEYTVEVIKDACNCSVSCPECGACVHKFCCSCPEFSVKWNLCRHSHATAIIKNDNLRNIDDSSSFLSTEPFHLQPSAQKVLLSDIEMEVTQQKYESEIPSPQNCGVTPKNELDCSVIENRKLELRNKFQEVLTLVETEKQVEIMFNVLSSSIVLLKTIKNESGASKV